MKKRLIPLLMIVLAACSGGQKNNSGLTVLDLTNDENSVESIPLKGDKALFKCKAVKLETNDSCLLGYVDNIYRVGDYWFITDAISNGPKMIRKFDKEGRYIKNIGRVGEGPHDYNHATTIFIDENKKTVNIICTWPNKMVCYDYDGNFVSNVDFKNRMPYYMNCVKPMENNEWLCCYGFNGDNNMRIAIVDADSFTVKKVLSTYPLQAHKNTSATQTGIPFTVAKDKVLFTDFLSDTIYSYSNGVVRPEMLCLFGKPILSREKFKSVCEENDLQFFPTLNKIDESDYTLGLFDMYENDQYICMGRMNRLEGFVLYNKKDKSYIRFSAPLPATFGYINSTCNNTFVKVWSSREIEKFREMLEKDLLHREDYPQEILNLVDNYDIEDNPVLLLYN